MSAVQSKRDASRGIDRAIAVTALVVAIAAILFALRSPKPGLQAHQVFESSLRVSQRTHILRAGYSGFRPYTIINLDTSVPDKRVSGFCVDMLNEIASRQSPPWKVQWEQVTFETLKADMESGRFDVFADAVYQTVPRGTDFAVTAPYSYFGVAVGLVRRGEHRFQKFEDVDRNDVTVALAAGWTATEYAQQHLKKAKLKIVPVADDPSVQLQEVIAGRADIALQDVPTVLQFARKHPNEVEALWIRNPPSRVPAGFMTRRDDKEMRDFLDVAIRCLQADGTIAALDRKWGGLSDFPELPLRRGAGL